ncbi:hypothetical protein A3Q56_06329, partial [Intoshia linei]
HVDNTKYDIQIDYTIDNNFQFTLISDGIKSAWNNIDTHSVYEAINVFAITDCTMTYESHIIPAALPPACGNLQLTTTMNTCVWCPPGTFKAAGTCTECPIATYSNGRTATCTLCTNDYTTIGTNSKSIEDCLPKCVHISMVGNGIQDCIFCAENEKFITDTNVCETCTAGTKVHRNPTECTPQCLPGEYSDNGFTSCVSCPISYYQNLYGSKECILCPSNSVTLVVGANIDTLCVIVGTDSCPAICSTNCNIVGNVPTCITCQPNENGPNCESFDLCTVTNCNGGTCTSTGSVFTCNCDDTMFSGINCDVYENNCLGVICENGGSCLNKSVGYTCLCINGYSGTHCANPDDYCTINSITCSGHGSCFNYAIRGVCKCNTGYEGSLCQNYVGQCANVYCESTNQKCDETNGQCNCLDSYENGGELSCLQLTDYCSANGCGDDFCLSNYVNKKFYCICPTNYFSKPVTYTITNQPLIETHFNDGACVSDTLCDPNPCQHGSPCIQIKHEFSCDCSQTVYKGKLCDVLINKCKPNPCKNGGVCSTLNGVYICDCEDNYLVADDCQSIKNFCTPDSCDATGSITNGCIELDFIFNYQCTCNLGYYGQDCSKSYNKCRASPCYHSGVCNQNAIDYTCGCVLPYEIGTQCENANDFCQTNTCANGTCKNLSNAYFCRNKIKLMIDNICSCIRDTTVPITQKISKNSDMSQEGSIIICCADKDLGLAQKLLDELRKLNKTFIMSRIRNEKSINVSSTIVDCK